jgi:hypothetical protein
MDFHILTSKVGSLLALPTNPEKLSLNSRPFSETLKSELEEFVEPSFPFTGDCNTACV